MGTDMQEGIPRFKEVMIDSKEYQLTSKKPISAAMANEILAKWQSSKTYNTASYSLKTKGCSVDVYRETEIFDNCIIDKLPVGAEGPLRRSIWNSCERIACSPGFLDKLKY